jgi:ubiquinone/menaquinone biosynthesis C-methylase UbiE
MGEGSLSSAVRANERKRRTFAKEAPTYDEEMEFFEKLMLGDEHRGWACSRAKGITLEVAIGTGLNLPHYPRDLSLTGIDLSPEMLALARTRAQRTGRSVELLEADAQDLPFPDHSFDTVVCTYALCSVPDDALAVREMTRVLRPGGLLILVDHVRSTVLPLYWLQWLYEFVPRRTKDEYMTRRPAQHVGATEFEIVAHDRLRSGIIERLVAVKRDPNTPASDRMSEGAHPTPDHVPTTDPDNKPGPAGATLQSGPSGTRGRDG